MERHFIYRAWVMLRVVAYAMAGLALFRGVLHSLVHADFSGFGPLVGQVGTAFGIWLVFEFIVEKVFAARQNPRKKLKKGEKPDKTERRVTPRVRIFYRRLSLSHLLPGRMNPVLLGLSEQDMEFNVAFRWYVALRYLVYISVGLVTMMMVAASTEMKRSWPGEGYLGAILPFLILRAVESSLLYLFLGSVMSGEDIHGAKTTRFFAFEPTASFPKRLTLPVLDRKGWLVSLHALRSRWGMVGWWAFRIVAAISLVLFAEAADSIRIGNPKLINSALGILIPFSIVYWTIAFDKVLGYLVFFPASKSKKKGDDTDTRTVEFRNFG